MWLQICLALVYLTKADDESSTEENPNRNESSDQFIYGPSGNEKDCYQLLYLPEEGYAEKAVMIYYDKEFEYLAKGIDCLLKTLNIRESSMTVLRNGVYVHEICNNRPQIDSLLMVLEAVAMAWGPVLFSSDKSRYKSLKLVEKALKSKLVVVPTLVVSMVFLLGVVGLMGFFANRKKLAADQRSLRNRKALLLAQWGDDQYEGSPEWHVEDERTEIPAQTNMIEMQELPPKVEESKSSVKRGSGEVNVSPSERSVAMDP
ncbi:unnamed protein product [Strongylus vulgaris]|uniref:Uncharacterized protein n=1 Tax=Strongylus vulgaris TaxID=40348 RepID=A0A3P7JFX8_STRVU|nr:unnamed protein product [Strongylus vulgaris]